MDGSTRLIEAEKKCFPWPVTDQCTFHWLARSLVGKAIWPWATELIGIQIGGVSAGNSSLTGCATTLTPGKEIGYQGPGNRLVRPSKDFISMHWEISGGTSGKE